MRYSVSADEAITAAIREWDDEAVEIFSTATFLVVAMEDDE